MRGQLLLDVGVVGAAAALLAVVQGAAVWNQIEGARERQNKITT